ncbi:MAG: BMP family ABC transporter substrate-binding protein [Clostridiales bacterium]|jgi:basic membrane protein A|nr:BMP family ABC transporter substrate-binding protein [Clostridiales bacterium]MCK9349942.1 BMP family ABC transporter substrate-binding protein [Clostridiales bacterium]MDD3540527.1 BMP family ABC transporter substrate-binding protein [Eubacteriales bacterium]MDY0119718.1 BMP family ABC transporter substrate-binding protein [Clostridia bacterium]NLG30141.1 BMP family ABC transporter substrate-binding protein [Clostridiaceae bacterium]
MKKRWISLFLVLVLILTLGVGCGPKEDPAKGKSVALITDIGGINDESFNQSAWNGMEQLKEEGINISFVESHKEADYAVNLANKTEEGNDLIWGIGFLMEEAMVAASKEHKDQMFAVVDVGFNEGDHPNLIGAMFHSEESSFLVGYIAGQMTKTDHVGFILGMEGDVMFRFQYGYLAGVAYAAKELGKEIRVDYVTIDTFGDTAKGKATATKMYSDGADIVYHAAGQAGSGAITAAKEMGKWAIGVDLDQNELAPDNVLTSALKNVDQAVYQLSKKVIDGEDVGGKTFFFGLKEGGVGIAPSSSKHVPQDILDKTKEIEKEIIDGKIDVPITDAEFEAFKANLG